MCALESLQRSLAQLTVSVVGVLLLVGVANAQGCVPFSDCGARLYVRGQILDSATLEGAPDAAVGGRTFTDTEETDFDPPLIFNGTTNFPPPTADGDFQISFSNFPIPCGSGPRVFPRPDRVEMIIVRDGCEQSFLIDINAETVVDPSAPDDVLELRDPILVPPCEP